MLLLLSGCDKRCNLEDCRALYTKCRSVLPAEPNYAHCGLGRGDLDEDTVIRDYDDDRDFRCAQACVASSAGEVLECVGKSQGSCDAARSASVVDGCMMRLSTADAGCSTECGETRARCEAACPGIDRSGGPPMPGAPRFDKRVCLDCVSKCGLAWGRCDAACRETAP